MCNQPRHTPHTPTQQHKKLLLNSFSALVVHTICDKVENIKNNANLCKSIVCGAFAIRHCVCVWRFSSVSFTTNQCTRHIQKRRIRETEIERPLPLPHPLNGGREKAEKIGTNSPQWMLALADALMNNSIRWICSTNANRLLCRMQNDIKKLLSLCDAREKTEKKIHFIWKAHLKGIHRTAHNVPNSISINCRYR